MYIKDIRSKLLIREHMENHINSSLRKAHLRLCISNRNTNCSTFRQTAELHFNLTTFWKGGKRSKESQQVLHVIHTVVRLIKIICNPFTCKSSQTHHSVRTAPALINQILPLSAATFTSKLDGS